MHFTCCGDKYKPWETCEFYIHQKREFTALSETNETSILISIGQF